MGFACAQPILQLVLFDTVNLCNLRNPPGADKSADSIVLVALARRVRRVQPILLAWGLRIANCGLRIVIPQSLNPRIPQSQNPPIPESL